MTEDLFFNKLVTKSMEAVHGEERFFEGYLTVQIKDKQGEITVVDELYKVLPVWMDRGAPISDTHSNRIIGKGINYSKETYKDKDGEEYPAIKITGKIHKDYELDNEIWKKIKSGEYKGLSFGGATKSDRDPVRMKDGSIAYSLKDLEHYEVAVCADPAVPLALITDYNPVAKSATNAEVREDGKMVIKCDKFGCYVTKPIPDGKGGKGDFDHCEEKNQDKNDPAAFCGAIQHKLEKAIEAGMLQQVVKNGLEIFLTKEELNKVCSACGKTLGEHGIVKYDHSNSMGDQHSMYNQNSGRETWVGQGLPQPTVEGKDDNPAERGLTINGDAMQNSKKKDGSKKCPMCEKELKLVHGRDDAYECTSPNCPSNRMGEALSSDKKKKGKKAKRIPYKGDPFDLEESKRRGAAQVAEIKELLGLKEDEAFDESVDGFSTTGKKVKVKKTLESIVDKRSPDDLRRHGGDKTARIVSEGQSHPEQSTDARMGNTIFADEKQRKRRQETLGDPVERKITSRTTTGSPRLKPRDPASTAMDRSGRPENRRRWDENVDTWKSLESMFKDAVKPTQAQLHGESNKPTDYEYENMPEGIKFMGRDFSEFQTPKELDNEFQRQSTDARLGEGSSNEGNYLDIEELGSAANLGLLPETFDDKRSGQIKERHEVKHPQLDKSLESMFKDAMTGSQSARGLPKKKEDDDFDSIEDILNEADDYVKLHSGTPRAADMYKSLESIVDKSRVDDLFNEKRSNRKDLRHQQAGQTGVTEIGGTPEKGADKHRVSLGGGESGGMWAKEVGSDFRDVVAAGDELKDEATRALKLDEKPAQRKYMHRKLREDAETAQPKVTEGVKRLEKPKEPLYEEERDLVGSGRMRKRGKSLESIVRGDAEANPDMSPNEWLQWYKKRPKKKAEESNFGAGQRGLGYGNEGYTNVQGSGQSHTISEIPPEMEIIVHDVNDIKESKKEGYTTEAGNSKRGDPSRATDDDDSLLSQTFVKT